MPRKNRNCLPVTVSAVGLERRRAADLWLTTPRPRVRRHNQLTLAAHSEAHPVSTQVAVLTYKVLHGCAPSHLGPFVRVADLPSRRALRSANTSRLIQPQSNRSTVGDRVFPVAGSQVSNSLPLAVTSEPSLDRCLNAHLFTLSYTDIQLF